MENLILEFSLSKQNLLIVSLNVDELFKQNIVLFQNVANDLPTSRLVHLIQVLF